MIIAFDCVSSILLVNGFLSAPHQLLPPLSVLLITMLRATVVMYIMMI